MLWRQSSGVRIHGGTEVSGCQSAVYISRPELPTPTVFIPINTPVQTRVYILSRFLHFSSLFLLNHTFAISILFSFSPLVTL
ncbi:hypothetical protein BDV19DRAFT_355603, partial [Aspergillus venezuelensis]